MAPPRVLVGISICLSLDMCSRSCNCLILCIILCVFVIIVFSCSFDMLYLLSSWMYLSVSVSSSVWRFIVGGLVRRNVTGCD